MSNFQKQNSDAAAPLTSNFLIILWIFAQINNIYDVTFTFFQITAKNDENIRVGRIVREWDGLPKDFFTFGISFPFDLHVCMKAVLLGAAFLNVSIRYVIYYILTYQCGVLTGGKSYEPNPIEWFSLSVRWSNTMNKLSWRVMGSIIIFISHWKWL